MSNQHDPLQLALAPPPSNSSDNPTQQREHIIRTICRVACGMALGYSLVYFLAGSTQASLFNGAMAALYLLTSYYASKTRAAGLFLIATGTMQLCGLGLLFLPPQTGTHIFLFLVPMFSVIVLDPKDRLAGHGLSGISILVLASLEYQVETFHPLLEIPFANWTYGPMHAASTAFTVLFAAGVFQVYYAELRRAREQLSTAYQRSEGLLLNILPAPIVGRLKAGETLIADDVPSATVLFSDLVGFTATASTQSAQETVAMLSDIFNRFDEAIARHEVEKIKTIGDAYMVASGVPVHRPGHTAQMLAFAQDILRILEQYNESSDYSFQLRIGVHTGPVTTGVIGTQKFAYDLWGDTVNIASRMESNGIPGRVQVSQEVVEAVGDAFKFESRGPIQVKGKGELEAFLLASPSSG